MLFAAVVRQAEDNRAVVYADTCQRTQSDERAVVLTAMIVGTLHKCALRKMSRTFRYVLTGVCKSPSMVQLIVL